MIDVTDQLLRHLLMLQVANLRPVPQLPPIGVNWVDETQVGFQPPSEDWHTYVQGLGTKNALNIFMFDLRENRKLRSSERSRTFESGVVLETPAPARVDCHYLISAWSPAATSPAVEPTIDEHLLLYQVAAVLMKFQPLVARQVYGNALPNNFPAELADLELPTAVLPVEGFPKYAEFWGTMGVNHRWKPAVYLVVTLPILFPAQEAGALVTTRITEYRQRGRPETAETWIQIAGTVTNAKGKPIPGAWVAIEPGAQTTTADEAGHFTFLRLASGTYTLTVRAQGYAPWSNAIQVPSPGGGYDVQLV